METTGLVDPAFGDHTEDGKTYDNDGNYAETRTPEERAEAEEQTRLHEQQPEEDVGHRTWGTGRRRGVEYSPGPAPCPRRGYHLHPLGHHRRQAGPWLMRRKKPGRRIQQGDNEPT